MLKLRNKYIRSFTNELFNERLQVYFVNSNEGTASFGEDVKNGLTAPNKYLLPKYFYDGRGSQLFEMICSTDEYYVTRTETEILRKYSDDIACFSNGKTHLIELGSGSSLKTEYLINSFLNSNKQLIYTPIDVSYFMINNSKRLIGDYEDLYVCGIVSEYEGGLELASQIFSKPKLIVFLGSSIGNFDLPQAKLFMRFISSKMDSDDGLLIGFDMKKDINVLNGAYNDKQGYTAEFNLNILRRINDELQGDFDLANFEHCSYFNETESRMEMHIVSSLDQEVSVETIDTTIHFTKGEKIHTENSYKFTEEMINDLSDFAGLKLARCWQDEKRYFSLCLFKLK